MYIQVVENPQPRQDFCFFPLGVCHLTLWGDPLGFCSIFEQVNNYSGFQVWHVLLRVQASYLRFLAFQHLLCKTANNTAKSIESMPLPTFWVYWYLRVWYKRVFWEPPSLLPGVCFHRRRDQTIGREGGSTCAGFTGTAHWRASTPPNRGYW